MPKALFLDRDRVVDVDTNYFLSPTAGIRQYRCESSERVNVAVRAA